MGSTRKDKMGKHWTFCKLIYGWLHFQAVHPLQHTMPVHQPPTTANYMGPSMPTTQLGAGSYCGIAAPSAQPPTTSQQQQQPASLLPSQYPAQGSVLPPPSDSHRTHNSSSGSSSRQHNNPQGPHSVLMHHPLAQVLPPAAAAQHHLPGTSMSVLTWPKCCWFLHPHRA